MAVVKPLAKTVEKYMKRASAATPEYTEGVEDTTKDQAALAIAAEENYEASLTAAFGRKAFSKGLRKSGHAKWRAKSSVKGSRNYAPGIRDAGPDYAEGFGPHHSALEGITYPPRGPRGSPQNLERVRIENETLHKVRVGM